MGMEEYARLQQILDETQPDLEKALRGNKAAGTRVRKKMQELKKQAQVVRDAMMGLRAIPES